jgi:CHC2-type zinc finger protein
MKLDTSPIRRYFESRLPDAKFRGNTPRKMERCPFHNDGTASLSIDMDSGVFNCFGCNTHGGYLAFEMKFSSCDEATAWANIVAPNLSLSVA